MLRCARLPKRVSQSRAYLAGLSSGSRLHSNHSHSHGWKDILPGLAHTHDHDDHPVPVQLGTKGLKSDDGSKVTLIGFGSNILLAGAKVGARYVRSKQNRPEPTFACIGRSGRASPNLVLRLNRSFAFRAYHSEALIADAAHSLADIISDLVTLSTIYLSNRPPSDRFPFGRAKLDALGSIFVSGLLLSGTVALGSHSLHAMFGAVAADGHDHLATALTSPAALYIAVGTIVVKEVLFRATMKKAQQLKSSVLVAAAWHHRADALSTGVAVLGIAGSTLLDWQWSDPLVGLIVAGLLAKMAVQNSIKPLQALVDYSPSPAPSVDQAILDALPRLSTPCTLTRTFIKVESGHHVAHIEIGLPNSATLGSVDAIARELKELLEGKLEGISRVDVRGQIAASPAAEATVTEQA